MDSLSPVGSGRKRARPNIHRECRARCKSRQNVLSRVESIVMLVMQPRVMSTSSSHASLFPPLLSRLASQGSSRLLVGGRWQNMHESTLQHSQTEHSLGKLSGMLMLVVAWMPALRSKPSGRRRLYRAFCVREGVISSDSDPENIMRSQASPNSTKLTIFKTVTHTHTVARHCQACR